MKPISSLFLVALIAAGPALSDPIEGLWRTAPDDHGDVGYIRVASCGNTYCGVLERAENQNGEAIKPDTLGRKIVWNLKPAKSGEYEPNSLLNPVFNWKSRRGRNGEGNARALPKCSRNSKNRSKYCQG